MNTLQITRGNSGTYDVAIGGYAHGRGPRVHGYMHDLESLLRGIERRHGGTSFATKDGAEGALGAAHLAALAGIRQ